MMDDETPDNSSTPADGVDGGLIDRLHQANEQFHNARRELEQAIDSDADVMQKREQARQKLIDAEKNLEEADEKIRRQFKKTDKGSRANNTGRIPNE